jgi:hypothetical protein
MQAQPFNYTITITGDCTNTNSGIISILPFGGTPPYTVEWILPSLGSDIVTTNSSIRTNLGSTTYAVRLNDSTLLENDAFYVNIPVSNGVCLDIVGVQDTTCDLDNGFVTGATDSSYSSATYFLYQSGGTFISSAITDTSEVVFTSLSAGTYYMTIEDLGGCSGRSQNFLVGTSTPADFGLYVVPNSGCGGPIPNGKIYVTGQTGSPPLSYVWADNISDTDFATGLTAGSYSVTMTDGYGCQVTKIGTVTTIEPVGFGSFTVTNPTCFASDGSITLTITGGTAPFYYSASTGNVEISYSRTWTVSNLPAGQFGFSVTDAGLCKFTIGTSLLTPQSLAAVVIISNNSSCSASGGTITATVQGGSPPYTYTLVKPGGSTSIVATNQTVQLFTGLTTGTYTIFVSDTTGCAYSDSVSIFATNTYTISTSVTGTTCNQNNGIIEVIKSSGGLFPFDYSLDGVQNIIDTNLSAVTFNNVTSGQHTITVVDATGCTQTTQVYVNPSTQLNFSIFPTSCGSGSQGSLTAFITSGNPPFTYNWSSNVVGNPQQIYVTGLTAGTYSLTLIDSNGCSSTRSTSINCSSNLVSYGTYVMGSQNLTVSCQSKYGLLQMLNDGFETVTSGETGCVLSSATFIASISIEPSGYTDTLSFYTGTTLVDVPSDNEWFTAIEILLNSAPGVGTVTVDPVNNQLIIQSNPADTSLDNQKIVIELIIDYNFNCIT